MENVFKNKKEFYKFVINAIKEDLIKKKLTTDSITNETYCISRRQYFYLKKIVGGISAPDVSEEKLKCLLNKLGFSYNIHYVIKK